MIKKIIKYIIPNSLVNYWRYRILDGYALRSYSQEGEDMILRRIFENKSDGFYIDVGAHHPKRFSNTFFFYKKGWRGINIDAMPDSMRSFRKERPRDISIEVPISAESKTMTYYIFNEPALNGFDARLSKEREVENSNYKVIQTVNLKTRRIDEVLNEYLPPGQVIDFLSIDVEGLDFEVLQSNDWAKYKPEVILVEVLGSSLASIADSEITEFLSEHDYVLYAKSVNTVVYRRVTQL